MAALIAAEDGRADLGLHAAFEPPLKEEFAPSPSRNAFFPPFLSLPAHDDNARNAAQHAHKSNANR